MLYYIFVNLTNIYLTHYIHLEERSYTLRALSVYSYSSPHFYGRRMEVFYLTTNSNHFIYGYNYGKGPLK